MQDHSPEDQRAYYRSCFACPPRAASFGALLPSSSLAFRSAP